MSGFQPLGNAPNATREDMSQQAPFSASAAVVAQKAAGDGRTPKASPPLYAECITWPVLIIPAAIGKELVGVGVFPFMMLRMG